MVIIIGLLFFLFCFLCNYIVTKDLLSPVSVLSGIWTIQFIGLILFSGYFIESSGFAIFIIIYGAISFYIGFYFAQRFKVSYLFGYNREIRISYRFNLIILIVIAFSAFKQYTIFRNVNPGGSFAETLVLARINIGTSGNIYGIYKYIEPLALTQLVGLIIYILRKSNSVSFRYLFLFISSLSLNVFLGVLSTGRSSVAHVIIISIIVFMLVRKIRKLDKRIFKLALLFVVVVFGVFWGMGSVMGKTSHSFHGALVDVIQYQFSPIPAFSVFLNNYRDYIFGSTSGEHVFRFFQAILSRIGFASNPSKLVQNFVFIPFSTNIFTWYRFYLEDFGLIGPFIVLLILGLFYGIIYKVQRKYEKSDFFIVLLSVSYIPLLVSPGGELFFSGMSVWLQIFIWSIILTRNVDVKSR